MAVSSLELPIEAAWEGCLQEWVPKLKDNPTTAILVPAKLCERKVTITVRRKCSVPSLSAGVEPAFRLNWLNYHTAPSFKVGLLNPPGWDAHAEECRWREALEWSWCGSGPMAAKPWSGISHQLIRCPRGQLLA